MGLIPRIHPFQSPLQRPASGRSVAWSEDDQQFMRRAIEVAEKGRGRVSPNPLVGCVLVKEGKEIAQGWHNHLGGLHAEQMAIHDAEAKGMSVNGATAYVTLEPCNHFGRTPPCTESLLWAGISKVIIAHEDPNPNVRGEGAQVLKNAGIEVEFGLLKQEAKKQMREFLHWCTTRRPFVTVKVATDAHGSVDDLDGDSKRFTSQACLEKVHTLRQGCDAILVGVNTVIRDDPRLTVRGKGDVKQPLRVVIDPNQRMPKDAKMLSEIGETKVLQDDFYGLNRMLEWLGDQEIQRVLVEGGPETIRRFMDEDLVDEIFIISTKQTHTKPVPLNIDCSKMVPQPNLLWGNETVLHWLKHP